MYNGYHQRYKSLSLWDILIFPFGVVFAVAMGIVFGILIGVIYYIGFGIVVFQLLKEYLSEKLCS